MSHQREVDLPSPASAAALEVEAVDHAVDVDYTYNDDIARGRSPTPAARSVKLKDSDALRIDHGEYGSDAKSITGSNGARRRSSAHTTRPVSLASLQLTSAAPTPNDLSGSRTFLLPQKPEAIHGHERPLAALERDFVGALGEYQPGEARARSRVESIEMRGSDNDAMGQGSRASDEVERGVAATNTGTNDHLRDRGWAFKALFVVVTCSAQLVAQAQFGMVMIPLYEVGRWLGTEEQGQLGWMAASYGLTVGMFLILSGSLGDLYGPKLAWLLGFVIVIAANIGSGFCSSTIPFNICRALGGVGAAFALPNAVAILGRTYPPGLMRSIVFAILGALAPVGFIIPGAYAALLADFGAVRWIWFSTALIAAAFAVAGMYILPADDPIPPRASRKRFDVLGAILLIAALGLFNFTWNQAPLVGWHVAYVWASLIVSVALFVAFYFWERRMGVHALIPVEVLTRVNLLVYTSLWLGWVSFGTFLFYTVLFIRNVRDTHTALGVAAQMAPLAPCALIIPHLITRVSGHIIFLLSMVAFLVGNIVMSVARENASYWGTIFPAFVIAVFGPDLSFSTGQLIVSNSVDRRFQGVAGGIVSMITNYSMSIGLGMASTVEIYVAPNGPHLKGYRSAFYFATGLAAVAVIVVGFFVRMPKMAHYRE